jgi:hypothetical protein
MLWVAYFGWSLGLIERVLILRSRVIWVDRLYRIVMNHRLEIVSPSIALVPKHVVPVVDFLRSYVRDRHFVNVLFNGLQHQVKLTHATIFILFVGR